MTDVRRLLATLLRVRSSGASTSPPAQFLDQVKDALENLYDLVYLRGHPLACLLVPTMFACDIKGAKILRQQILEAIEQLKPGDKANGAERLWRTYRILHLRYVEVLPFRKVMYELGLSQTQYHREQRRAIAALAAVLWEIHQYIHVPTPPAVPLVITKTNIKAVREPTAPVPVQRRLPKEEQVYTWVAAVVADPFYVHGRLGWEAAARALGVRASFVGPFDADVGAQVTMLQRIIAKPTTAGILVYPLNYAAVEPVLRKACQRGIAIVLGNSDAGDNTLRDAFVGPVNEELGIRAADLAAELLKGEGKVGVIGLMCRPQRTRFKAFEERLKRNHPGVGLIGVVATDGSIEGTAWAADALLSMHPDVELIYVPDTRAGRVAAVVRERGLSGQVLIIATGKNPDVLDAIDDSTITASVVQDTYAEEFIALHYLYWQYNNISLPDTTIVRATTTSQLSELSWPTLLPQTSDLFASRLSVPEVRVGPRWP